MFNPLRTKYGGGPMSKEKCHRQVGYQQGFDDGKITRGKINKKYLEKLFKSETQNLSNQESILYKTGWQDGFVDAVRGGSSKYCPG